MKQVSFKGSFQTSADSSVEPLMLDHTIFRGCTLRNTDWAIGFATYAGEDTKIMKNSREAPAKMSNMQHVMNRLVRGYAFFEFSRLFAFLAIIVLVSSIFSMEWNKENIDSTMYLQLNNHTVNEFKTGAQAFFIKILVQIHNIV